MFSARHIRLSLQALAVPFYPHNISSTRCLSFTRHSSTAPITYIYFDNNQAGYAARNALELIRLVNLTDSCLEKTYGA